MPGRRYLCLDCGLTAAKAVLFDESGHELAAAGAPTPVRAVGEASEIDMEEQWLLAARLLRETLARAGGIPGGSPIAAIGVSGHGGGLYPVDASGRPVCRAFTSLDGRAASIVEEWAREGRSRYAVTRHHPWAGQPLPQLRYLRDRSPAVYGRIRWALGAKDWMVHRLTGEFSTDRTDASNDALLDLATDRYDRGLFDTFGVPEVEGMLPPVHRSAEVVGGVSAAAAAATGLPAGVPVVAGMFDVAAGAVGAGALGESAFSLIAGTWNINSAFDERLLETAPSVKTSLGPDPGRFLYVESSASSAGCLAWFLSALASLPGADARGREALYRGIDAAISAVPPGAGGVVFLPFVHRAHIAPGVDAAFVGLRAGHGLPHLLRAVCEGVAFAHRAHLEILERAGLARDRVVLSGGGASSPAWCRIFADVLGRPVETTDASQACARGVAVAAAVGAGLYRSCSEAMAAMIRPGAGHEPDPGRVAAYREAWARFRDTADRLAAGRGETHA